MSVANVSRVIEVIGLTWRDFLRLPYNFNLFLSVIHDDRSKLWIIELCRDRVLEPYHLGLTRPSSQHHIEAKCTPILLYNILALVK